MSKILLPVGMIGSGKSTWARKYIKENPNTKIVGGDEIRFMLHGGEYVHDEDLESAVIPMLIVAARVLLEDTDDGLKDGYDVILDECYCSLSAQMRKWVAQSFPDTELIAVVFPERDMQDHIDDKILKGLRGKTVKYWKRVFCEMKEIYEPLNPEEEEYFSDAIYVGEDKP